jgi:hypothetical protein
MKWLAVLVVWIGLVGAEEDYTRIYDVYINDRSKPDLMLTVPTDWESIECGKALYAFHFRDKSSGNICKLYFGTIEKGDLLSEQELIDNCREIKEDLYKEKTLSKEGLSWQTADKQLTLFNTFEIEESLYGAVYIFSVDRSIVGVVAESTNPLSLEETCTFVLEHMATFKESDES